MVEGPRRPTDARPRGALPPDCLGRHRRAAALAEGTGSAAQGRLTSAGATIPGIPAGRAGTEDTFRGSCRRMDASVGVDILPAIAPLGQGHHLYMAVRRSVVSRLYPEACACREALACICREAQRDVRQR